MNFFSNKLIYKATPLTHVLACVVAYYVVMSKVLPFLEHALLFLSCIFKVVTYFLLNHLVGK